MAAMSDQDPRPRPAPDVVEAGIPATEEIPDEMIRTGDAMEGELPPLEHPQGVEEYGTTAVEQQRPESLEDRVAREQPDLVGADVAEVSPLVPPDTAGGLRDPDSDLLGDEEDLLDDTLAPEEAALRLTEDLPGATDDASPGYLDES